MEEIWKPVVGYEGLYEVSNLGNVRGLKRGKVLKPGKGRYLFVVLCKDGIRHETSVHRLVATAFCPNPNNKPEVNHLNEIAEDNRASNLEWCTRIENLTYGSDPQRRADTQRNDPKRSIKIAQYSLDGEHINTFPSIREMERQTGFGRNAVCKCARGSSRYSHAYGYLWRYVSE